MFVPYCINSTPCAAVNNIFFCCALDMVRKAYYNGAIKDALCRPQGGTTRKKGRKNQPASGLRDDRQGEPNPLRRGLAKRCPDQHGLASPAPNAGNKSARARIITPNTGLTSNLIQKE